MFLRNIVLSHARVVVSKFLVFSCACCARELLCVCLCLFLCLCVCMYVCRPVCACLCQRGSPHLFESARVRVRAEPGI